MKKLLIVAFGCMALCTTQVSNCFLKNALKELKKVSQFNRHNREEIYSWIYNKAEQLVDTYNLRQPTETTLSQKNVVFAGTVPPEIQEIIEDIQNNQQYITMGARCPHTYMFYGPKGIGKKSIVHAIVQTTKATSIYHAISSDAPIAEMIKKIDAENKRSESPTIILLDGVDNLTQKQLYSCSRALCNLQNNNLFIIALAQNPDTCSAIFEKTIALQKPDKEQRKAIIEYYLSKTKNTIYADDIEKIADQTNGYTPQEIKDHINQAALVAVRQKATSITKEHVLRALKI